MDKENGKITRLINFDVNLDRYWCPLKITQGIFGFGSDVNPGGPGDSSKISLGKDESITLKADISKFMWGQCFLSDWPNKNLYKAVPGGIYNAYLEVIIYDVEQFSFSNEIKINICE